MKSYGDQLSLIIGHKYKFQITDENRLKYIKNSWINSNFYNTFKDNYKEVKNADILNINKISHIKEIHSKLDGLATMYENVEKNKNE